MSCSHSISYATVLELRPVAAGQGDHDQSNMRAVCPDMSPWWSPSQLCFSGLLLAQLSVRRSGSTFSELQTATFRHHHHGMMHDIYLSGDSSVLLRIKAISDSPSEALQTVSSVQAWSARPVYCMPRLLGVTSIFRYGFQLVCQLEEYGGDSLEVWLDRFLKVPRPRHSDLALAAASIVACFRLVLQCGLTGSVLLNHLSQHHFLVKGGVPWQKEGHGLTFVDAPEPTLEAVWCDPVQVTVNAFVQRRGMAASILAFALGISCQLKKRRGDFQWVWHVVACETEGLGIRLNDLLKDSHMVADADLLRFAAEMLPGYEQAVVYVTPLGSGVAGLHSGPCRERLLSSPSEWPMCWDRLHHGMCLRLAQKKAVFRGANRFSIPDARRCARSSRSLVECRHQGAAMRKWCSDVLNSLIHLFFICLQPIFQAALFSLAVVG
jgi:hypothetical protein